MHSYGGDGKIFLVFYRLGEAGSIQVQIRVLEELADMIMRPVSTTCEKARGLREEIKKKLSLHSSLKILRIGLWQPAQCHGCP